MKINNTLYTNGGRKYVSENERKMLICAARNSHGSVRTFAETLTYTGCRISEALALTADHIDMENQEIRFETLKKRRRDVWRSVPVPEMLLEHLDLVHSIRRQQGRPDQVAAGRLWPISRATAWRQIAALMNEAGIQGVHASPKGLRHGFGVAAVQSGVPLNLVQRWLGHSNLETTSIYAQAVGEEEHRIAARMFSEFRTEAT